MGGAFSAVFLFRSCSLKIAFFTRMELMMEKITTAFSHSFDVEKFSILNLYLSQSDVREASSRYRILSAILFKESSSLLMVWILTWLATKVKLKAFALLRIIINNDVAEHK